MDPLIAIALLGTGPALYGVSCLPEVRGLHDWLYPGALFRTDHPHVVLTFDDGPDPERTPRLLDALAAANARAVFFVVGERASQHPKLIERMAREGHQVENHSWSHPWMPIRSTRRIETEVDRCQALIEELTGEAPRFMRPPYGQRDFRLYRVLAEREITPVLWTRSLRDYYHTKPATLVRRLSRARPGDIVMCHDGDPLAPHTATAIETWLGSEPRVGPL